MRENREYVNFPIETSPVQYICHPLNNKNVC